MTVNLKVRWTLEKSYRQFPFDANMTAKQVIETVARKNKIPNPQDYCIFVPPNASGNGLWMESHAVIGHAGLKSGDLIELKLTPHPITLVLADQSPRWPADFGFREDKILARLRVDFSDPLSELVPIVERILTRKDKEKEEFSFQYLFNNGTTQGIWLNANISLEEQDVSSGAWLAIHPLSHQSKRSVESLKEHRMSGFLTKVSIKETKTTGSKRRWCVLKDNFLFYFKSQQEKTPNGVVAVEYYILVTDKADRQFQLAPAPGCPFPRITTTYEFSADSENEYKEWVKALRDRSATGAGKKVFGVPLAKVLRRKDRLTCPLPAVMEKTIKYLEDSGLRQEGIFRVSGGAAVIEKFKDEFDQSLDVDLNRCGDPHVVAGLLKLYLRELPEPLLTFELYDKFIATFQTPDRTQRLKALVDQIPPIYRHSLVALLSFLKKVSEHSKTNLMSIANLATVFAPNLLRPRVESPESLVQDAVAVNTLMEALIQEQEVLFGTSTPTTSPGMSSGTFTPGAVSDSSPTPVIRPTSAVLGRGGMNMGAIAQAAVGGVSALKRSTPPKGTPTGSPTPTVTERADKPQSDRPPALGVGDKIPPQRRSVGQMAPVNSSPTTAPAGTGEVAIGLYDYTAGTKGEISFPKGAVMKILKKYENGWINADFNGTVGLIPSTYVRVEAASSEPAPAPAPVPTVVVPALPKAQQTTFTPGHTSGSRPPASPRGMLSQRSNPSVSVAPAATPTQEPAPAASSPAPTPAAASSSPTPSPASSTSPSIQQLLTQVPSQALPFNAPPEGDLRSQVQYLTDRLREEVKARDQLQALVTTLLSKLEEETNFRTQLELKLLKLESK